MASSKLCESCSQFDVRTLLLAALEMPLNNRTHIRSGVPRFFELQPNLVALLDSASRCNLCSAICRYLLHSRDHAEITQEELSDEIYAQPIHLETDDWDTQRHRAPHVVATQKSAADGAAGRCLAYFDVCCLPGEEPDDWQEMLGRVQASSSDDAQCLAVGRSWIKECTETHVLCGTQPPTTRLPTRALDVGRDHNTVFLVQGAKCSGTYAALSYCWGEPTFFNLREETKSQLESGFAIDKFPATLRDAVTVTQKLGIRYLWIDALCIIQGSEKDWAQEAGRMSDVYRGAEVTIEVASSAAAIEGFLVKRSDSKPYASIPWLSEDAGGERFVQLRPDHDNIHNQLVDTTIFSRGWTLQERLLAPRTLSFGQQQISFECAQGYQDEARIAVSAQVPHGAEHHLRKQSLLEVRSQQGNLAWLYRWFAPLLGLPTSMQIWGHRYDIQGQLQINRLHYGTYNDYWRLIVERFTRRNLRFVSDRLPALSGIAKEIQKATGDVYYAGLWKTDLLPSLCWRVSYRSAVDTDATVDQQENSKDLAPSWSWASVKGQVEFLAVTDDGVATTFEPKATILRIHCRPKTRDPFGIVEEGLIDILGPTTDIPSPWDQSDHDPALGTLHKLLQGPWGPTTHQRRRDRTQLRLKALQLLTRKIKNSLSDHSICLLLVLESRDDGTWRRVHCKSVQLDNFYEELDQRVCEPTEFDISYAKRNQEIGSQFHAVRWQTERLRIC